MSVLEKAWVALLSFSRQLEVRVIIALSLVLALASLQDGERERAMESITLRGDLKMIDKDGGTRAWLRSEGPAVVLSLYGGDGSEKIALTARNDGASSIALLGSDGKGRLKLAYEENAARPGGAQAFTLSDQNGVDRCVLAQGGPMSGIAMRDESGQVRLIISLGESGSAGISLIDENGLFLHSLPPSGK